MARGLKFRIKEVDRDCTIYVAITKVLISCVVTAKLICPTVFTYAKADFLIKWLMCTTIFTIHKPFFLFLEDCLTNLIRGNA